MTVQELHDLLAEEIKKNKGSEIILLSDKAVDGVLSVADNQLIESFVQPYAGSYDVLDDDEVERGHYENQDFYTAFVLYPKD